MSGRVVELALVFIFFLTEKKRTVSWIDKVHLEHSKRDVLDVRDVRDVVHIQYRIDKDERTESGRPWLPCSHYIENM